MYRYMQSDLSKFTLRTNKELLKKFRFVADYNARSANREIEVLMKKYVNEFEKSMAKLHLNNLYIQLLINKLSFLTTYKSITTN